MGITIGSFSANALTAQPFGYEGEARTGLTARTFIISGLLTADEWQALVSEYDTWRNARITDEDTLKSGVVGSTVDVSIDAANGLSVTSLKCWFTEPPSADQTGSYVSARAVLVDAAQALEVLLRKKEKDDQATDSLKPDLGTVVLGGCTVTLTKPMETRQDGPTVAMTATGASYISGPLAAHESRQIEGYISTGTYEDLLSWYDTTVAAVPSVGSWFPVSAPSATAEAQVVEGVKTTKYNISVTAIKIR